MSNITVGVSLTLKCLGSIEGSRFLDGRTGDGTVGLAPSTDSPFTGTHWEVIDDGLNRVVLKCLGNIEEPRFLDGRTGDGTVGLAPSTDGPFTGTHWEVMRKDCVQISSKDELQTPIEQPTYALAPVSTIREVRSCAFDLARLQIGVHAGRIVLEVPLQGSLIAVEITAICKESVFTLNLDVDPDIAYHFDIRSSQGQIVQNTLVSGVWGTEDRLAIPPDFASNQSFTLKITVEQMLIVYLNDRVLSRYAHRLPPAQINAVRIVYLPGNLQVQSVQVFEYADTEIEIPQGDRGVQPSHSEQHTHPSPSASKTTVQAAVTLTETDALPQFLRDLPHQFEPLRSLLEGNFVPYIKIQVGEAVGSLDSFNSGTGDPLSVWQSKIGGNPYFPKGMEYPVDPDTDKAMPLLMQINCADVPPIAGFNFPQQGILQFYLGFEPSDAESTPGKYRVLYFSEISTDESSLIADFSFIEYSYTIRESYPEVYPITFAASLDVFWEHRQGENMDISKELGELSQTFNEWLWDYLLETETRIRGTKLSGYVDLHSTTDEIAESANGRLLLELVHPSCCDDSFLFFITDEQLHDRDFSKVEFHFVCD